MPGMLWVILGLLIADAIIIQLLNYVWNGRCWYIPVLFVFCNFLTCLWLWAMHVVASEKNMIYRFSIMWDIAFILVTTLFPLILGVKPNAKLLIGATLAVVAIYLVKTASE